MRENETVPADVNPENEDFDDTLVVDDAEVTDEACREKLKKLREDLREYRKQSMEYLEGWQRTKADFVNFKRTAGDELARAKERARHEVLSAILPALDSFESARADGQWSAADPAWKTGVERIHDQLVGICAKEGVTAFAEAGDPFDPTLHDCISVVPATLGSQNNTVAQVLQRGYRVGESVLRPAKVVVAQFEEPHTP